MFIITLTKHLNVVIISYLIIILIIRTLCVKVKVKVIFTQLNAPTHMKVIE